MKYELMDGNLFRSLILTAAQAVHVHRQQINALNVFPVPDGDTGTNMYLTIQSAAAEAQKLDSISIAKVADAVAMGALMGARGNSGVILSQLLRGFAKAVEGKEKINPHDFAKALQEGVNTAYKAVMRPVEGTILTVAKDAAKQALASARQHKTFIQFMGDIRDRADDSLQKTPNLLPVLRQAGVVDAGGAGLLYIYEGFLAALEGKGITELATRDEENLVNTKVTSVIHSEQEITFAYCTEVIVKGTGLNINEIRDYLTDLGDSLLVVGTPELVKIHVHTNRPGAVLEHCVELGSLSQIKIENMREQHQHLLTEDATGELSLGESSSKSLGVVAVTVGEGLTTIFKSLGADIVVEGGQTMNPSTEELVKAVNSTNASKVVILPNNSNIILAAQQAQSMTGKEVLVIPTRSMPQGLAALLALNHHETDLEQIRKQMERAMQRVKTGQITHAVRDSQIDGIDIKSGHYLGLLNGKINVVAPELAVTVDELLTEMVDEDDEIITIYYGLEVEPSHAEHLAQRINRRFPHCEVELHSGGQPVYYYIFSVE